MSGIQSQVCVTSNPVLCLHSPFREAVWGRAVMPGLEKGAQILHPTLYPWDFP